MLHHRNNSLIPILLVLNTSSAYLNHFLVHILPHGELLPGLYQLLLQIGPGPHLYVADTGVVKLSQQILQLHVVNSFFLYFSVEFRSDLEGIDKAAGLFLICLIFDSIKYCNQLILTLYFLICYIRIIGNWNRRNELQNVMSIIRVEINSKDAIQPKMNRNISKVRMSLLNTWSDLAQNE